MLKVINNIAATIIGDLFITYHSYNFRSKSKFVVPSVCTVHNSQNSIQYYDPLIWNMIPGFIKDSETLDILKGKYEDVSPLIAPVASAKNKYQI